METKKISKDTMLREMKKRKSAVQKKMMKTADRIRLIEDFKNSTITMDGTFGIKKGLFSWGKVPYKYTYKVKDFM